MLQINNRSIQDLQIFGDPSRVPIVIVERVINAPSHSLSGNSLLNPWNQENTKDLNGRVSPPSDRQLLGANTHQNGRVLKIVVFVHGFQVCFV